MASVSDEVLDALGDRTRRAILEKLRAGPLAVVDIARGLAVGRPAVSQHLKILKRAGLVADHAAGTRRIYRVDPTGLAALEDYARSFWSSALARYREAAQSGADPRPAGPGGAGGG